MDDNLFYKFRDFGENTDKIILNSEFYFSSPFSFNDPFDCNLMFRNDYRKEEIEEYYKNLLHEEENVYQLKHCFKNNEKFVDMRKVTNKKILERIGIFSLSKDFRNILIWSHYANEHKGLVFCLDKEKDNSFFNTSSYVSYSTEYDLLSYACNDIDEYAKWVLTKSNDWSYEKEFRVIKLKGKGLNRFNKKMLISIIFGCRAIEANIKKIIQLCMMNGFKHVEFKKAKLIPGKFALDFIDIDKKDYLD